VVRVGAANDTREHDRFVGLVLEVAVPELVELGPELFEFLLGGPQLPASVDGVRGKESARRLGLPLAVDLYNRG
jgi:hypothetical protein